MTPALQLEIVFAQKNNRYEKFRRALEDRGVVWSVLTLVSARIGTMLDRLSQPKTRECKWHVVVINCEELDDVEEMVRAVLQKIPWQEIVLIGGKPLEDASLKVTCVATVIEAAEAIKHISSQ